MRDEGLRFYFTNVIKELLKEFKDYVDVFLKKKAAILSEFIKIMYIILIKSDKDVLYGLIYSLFANELRILRNYIKNNLIKEWIRKFKLFAKTFIFFTSKKDGEL